VAADPAPCHIAHVRWALLYGVLLCNARAMGEFGAVSVVSGHIRGLTNTIPLHVEILYNEYNFVAAFAMASLLALLALLTLVGKTIVEWRFAISNNSPNPSARHDTANCRRYSNPRREGKGQNTMKTRLQL
jgi:ABC-type sulfate transport system permease subunit